MNFLFPGTLIEPDARVDGGIPFFLELGLSLILKLLVDILILRMRMNMFLDFHFLNILILGAGSRLIFGGFNVLFLQYLYLKYVYMYR